MALSNNFAPGVRVEEAAPVAAPINTGRTLTAMMGSALRGPVNDVRLITSWSQFVSTYGGFSTNVDLATHIWQFFANGGAAVRVLRVAPSDAVGADSSSDVVSNINSPIFTVYAANPGEWGNDLALNLVLKSIESTAGQQVIDVDGNDLPNTAANVKSLDVARIPVSNITKLAPGDRVDIFDTAGQPYADSVLVLAVDSTTNSVIIEKPSSDVDGSGYFLKTNSQHRAKTFAAEDLADDATSILLDSTEGVNKGSLLSLYLYSHCETDSTRGLAAKSHVVVERVSGNRVYFTAPAVNAGDYTLPAQTKAALKYTSDDGAVVSFEAKDAGPTGNRVTIVITTSAAANSVSVSGKTITINSNTAGYYTAATLKTAIEANAAADALVAVTVNAGGDIDSSLVATRLTGGAKLLVTSQEFGAIVSLGESEVARHDFLSLISTNKDFVQYRLGGDPATFAPVSGSESSLIIIDGANVVVGTAEEEYDRLPRCLAGVGLSGGDDGSELTDADYIGESTPATGSYLLASYSDIKLACAPGVTSPDAQIAFVERAKEEGSFVWVLDPPSDVQGATDVLNHLTNDLALNTSFAMLSNSWLYVADFRPGSLPRSEIFTPSSPVVCGLIATGQKVVGDHGSCGNQVPVGVIRLAYNPSKTDRAQLNEAGVSCFAIIDGTIRLYGDRTLLSTNDVRRFGSVRRWLNAFIQKAEAGLSNVVFAPNNENLFPRVEQIIENILAEEFQKGALYPDNDRKRAYYVRCNSETTTAEMVAQGVVGLEVAVSPATQAEQIVMQLSVSAGGLTVANNI
jgi:hypothetical protein